jgi:7,8-dihydropterin-6-yl-methyl-4-(beta-D-ribofuranosyl)aminobenzene 5'-phosphate synthase
MLYTDKAVEHFMNPRNVGKIADADGMGEIGSEECGDLIRVYIKVCDNHLVDVKYMVYGCPAAIACCSMMTELAIGKELDAVWDLTDDQVADALGGLPSQKFHCSNLAASTLHKAIMNYIFQSPCKKDVVSITVLIDNSSSGHFRSEHGLSLWIHYQNKRILFDTGQSNAILQNAKALKIDLDNTDAIVLSHGHYDHTGGLSGVLSIASKAKLYLHPAATQSKFSQKASGAKSIGMSNSEKEAIQGRNMIWTVTPAQLSFGISVTGQIPRMNDYEDAGGAFFVDEKCEKPDELLDDQALFMEARKGLIVVLGCAHSGVVNILDYISKLTGCSKIYALIGGMHLLNASHLRIENTINTFKKYDVEKIIPLHCTGQRAMEDFKTVFGNKCLFLGAGSQIYMSC